MGAAGIGDHKNRFRRDQRHEVHKLCRRILQRPAATIIQLQRGAGEGSAERPVNCEQNKEYGQAAGQTDSKCHPAEFFNRTEFNTSFEFFVTDL
jgi:hypothetical protein